LLNTVQCGTGHPILWVCRSAYTHLVDAVFVRRTGRLHSKTNAEKPHTSVDVLSGIRTHDASVRAAEVRACHSTHRTSTVVVLDVPLQLCASRSSQYRCCVDE
jgi:hypothetical protein